jgi:hypothetical protein
VKRLFRKRLQRYGALDKVQCSCGRRSVRAALCCRAKWRFPMTLLLQKPRNRVFIECSVVVHPTRLTLAYLFPLHTLTMLGNDGNDGKNV